MLQDALPYATVQLLIHGAVQHYDLLLRLQPVIFGGLIRHGMNKFVQGPLKGLSATRACVEAGLPPAGSGQNAGVQTAVL